MDSLGYEASFKAVTVLQAWRGGLERVPQASSRLKGHDSSVSSEALRPFMSFCLAEQSRYDLV